LHIFFNAATHTTQTENIGLIFVVLNQGGHNESNL